MFTNRFFNLILAAVLLVIGALLIQQVFVTKAIPKAGNVYTESNEQILREYQLGERYGALPPYVTQFSAEQLRREYSLGERYGVSPLGYAQQRALREYWLGERYGQRPQK